MVAVLRVCSGTARGILLKSPPGKGVRPTSGRVREAVFSALFGRIPGSTVLDLYAGTGAMGIEALSRGAAEAVFVELSPACVCVIRENLHRTGFKDQATVFQGDALTVVRNLGRHNRKFTLVIADPPYEERKRAPAKPSLPEKTLKALVESGILGPDSLVVLEHSGVGPELEAPEGLRLLSIRKYGGTAVSILSPKPKQ